MTTSTNTELKLAMGLSLGVGIFLFLLKFYAYWITHSTAILSDASESILHLFAVAFATYSLWLSLKPADKNHLYGHDRISFFSAGFEGAMIIIAALYIIYEAINHIIEGTALQNLSEGIYFVAGATIINGFLGFFLLQRGKVHGSLILQANGKHVLTDCGTSLAVIVALIVVNITGIMILDPLIAIAAALNILWTGFDLVKNSIGGLMDQADPLVDSQLNALLKKVTTERGLDFHEVKHRFTGSKTLVEFHLLFPEQTSLAEAHEQATQVEAFLQRSLPCPVEILTHLEPKETHNAIHEKYAIRDYR